MGNLKGDLNYFELHYNDSSSKEKRSTAVQYDMVFMDQVIVNQLRDYEDAQGKKCFQLDDLHLRSSKVAPDTLVTKGDFITKKITAVDDESSIPTSFEQAMAECATILSSQKVDGMIDALLALVGRYYQCERNYIFSVNQQDFSLYQRFLWSSTDEEPQRFEMNHPKLVEALLLSVKEKNINQVIDLNDQLDDAVYASEKADFFQKNGIKRLLLTPILGRDGAVVGFMGICNPIGEHATGAHDYRLFRAITHFIEENFNQNSLLHEMKQMNEVDALTGFASRSRYADFTSKVNEMTYDSIAVVFVNINGLRRTNDEFGYEIGDQQIRQASDLLKKHFSQTFYRISGDEFVCFALNVSEKEFLDQLDGLRNAMKESGEAIFSVGHAWKKGRCDIQKLVAQADTMMYINKQDYYYTAHKHSGEVGGQILRELLSSIEDEEFMVYLQPQIRLEDEIVIGAEALIRKFDKKAQKMVFPDQFIPLYEQNSIIRHVDIFVLEQVCKMLVEWEKIGKAVPISVNLSRVTLLESNIAQTIADVCDKYGVPHDLIVVEVTERVGLIENDVESVLIDTIRKQGFRISLDDFGCAYSNIVTLVKISVDEIKIDKSLVDDLMTSEKNQIIVGNILNMCNSFKETHTLAEGIEVAEQAEILKDFGCTYGQGYYYSRPIPHEEFFEKYIAQKNE